MVLMGISILQSLDLVGMDERDIGEVVEAIEEEDPMKTVLRNASASTMNPFLPVLAFGWKDFPPFRRRSNDLFHTRGVCRILKSSLSRP